MQPASVDIDRRTHEDESCRTVYLAKLPGLAKKLRVMVGWTLDLFFGREIGQMITLRDVEMVSDRLARLRDKAVTP